MTKHETALVQLHLAEQKQAIIAAIHADKSEVLTCVSVMKIIETAYFIENLND